MLLLLSLPRAHLTVIQFKTPSKNVQPKNCSLQKVSFIELDFDLLNNADNNQEVITMFVTSQVSKSDLSYFVSLIFCRKVECGFSKNNDDSIVYTMAFSHT